MSFKSTHLILIYLIKKKMLSVQNAFFNGFVNDFVRFTLIICIFI